MSLVDRTYTGKFKVGQRVRNKVTKYYGRVVEVDPRSFTPPKGIAEHYPYRVSYFNWVSAKPAWDSETELESA